MGSSSSHIRRQSLGGSSIDTTTSKKPTAKFSKKELATIRQEFEAIAKSPKSKITRDQFKTIISKHTAGGSLFLERLFDAFDVNGDKTIDLDEFINGLGIFSKGTPQEKMELTFKIYDINRDGHVTMNEINKVLMQIYSSFYNDDQSAQIKEMTKRLFDDLDVDGDGELTFEEYKLSALKEPMIVNFLDQFMVEI